MGLHTCHGTNLLTATVESPFGTLTLSVCHYGLHSLTLPKKSDDELIETIQEIDRTKPLEYKLLFDKSKIELNSQQNTEVKFLDFIITYLNMYFRKPSVIKPNTIQFRLRHICATNNSLSTEFERKVLATLLEKVTIGKIISYKELAKAVGSPRAFRAVGSVMKMNKTPLLVRCHRVIRKDGTPRNYSGGKLNFVKTYLLYHETTAKKTET